MPYISCISRLYDSIIQKEKKEKANSMGQWGLFPVSHFAGKQNTKALKTPKHYKIKWGFFDKPGMTRGRLRMTRGEETAMN
jgi:hypothetical protein